LVNKQTKILFILWPSPANPDLLQKKLEEIAIKMDDKWKIFALKGNLPKHSVDKLKLPCPSEFHSVKMFGSHKNILFRFAYFLSCITAGVHLVKKENIDVITQHDGHLEYGIAAYIISRITHRKCLIRVNEDTLIPLIFFLKSSNIPLLARDSFLKIISSTYRAIERVFFSRVDWIVTHGPMDYQKIKLFTNKITFVPLWVDIRKFRRFDDETIAKLKEKYVIPQDMKILLFVGRLHPEKGVPTLLKALKRVQEENTLLLMIYSFSAYKLEYESLSERLGISKKIRFIGYVPHNELPSFYNIADVCILPSIREQWSNTIMESMACETPIIATNVGANPYLVEDGKSGFLIQPNDNENLAQKINFVFGNPILIKTITQSALTEIIAYDVNNIGELYKTVIKNLLEA
jgi:glycosyltransferase involved in cell wall biosynthesis